MPGILTLIPTELERLRLQRGQPDNHQAWELCGFGPIVAAARTAQLIAQHDPERVILLGIAGSLHSACSIGDAYCFDAVRCDGIGVGLGANFSSASEIGFTQWTGTDQLTTGLPGRAIRELLPLHQPKSSRTAGELLSVCTASANSEEADMRRQQYPNAMAEDMEAFAVAAACALRNVPLTVLRGISNIAGDRDKQNWRIDEALAAVAECHFHLY